ncbi:ABC transporter ATP-binding protein [Frankia sp. R82]|uniref:ABC transporter ATP-binding protein n=1 Tax=Frankia sp. R82 TaxID=2950553 RepID=UPI002044230C|nr:ABC transporter ATP-binding protein [Frankia sp. R82]MCM3885409.1 ABC transporter ATP-binding protein [Frankia sp. R82]
MVARRSRTVKEISDGAPAEPVSAPGLGVELDGIRRRFGDTLAVADVDLRIEPGSRVGIVGPSGCGKSTLLSIICGLDEPDAGHLSVLGATDAPGRLARCAWMPQQDLLLPWRSVLANARISLENQGHSREEASRRVWPLLERFGLAEFAGHRPATLSGGMRQRVSFLRTLAAGKPVLLLDEPFGALDAITRADLQGWLRSALATEPRTVLLVTHDVEEALLLCDRVAVMSSRPGQIVATFDVPILDEPGTDTPGTDGPGNDGPGTDGPGVRGTTRLAAATRTSGSVRRARLADPRFIALRDAVLASLEQAREPELPEHEESRARSGATIPEPVR